MRCMQGLARDADTALAVQQCVTHHTGCLPLGLLCHARAVKAWLKGARPPTAPMSAAASAHTPSTAGLPAGASGPADSPVAVAGSGPTLPADVEMTPAEGSVATPAPVSPGSAATAAANAAAGAAGDFGAMTQLLQECLIRELGAALLPGNVEVSKR